MKKLISILLFVSLLISCPVAVGVSAEDEEEKIIFEYDIYDSSTFGYDYVYAGIFKKYSEVNKPWTLEDFPGVEAYSVVDTWAMSEETAARYKATTGGTENFHQILKFDIIDKTPDGCLAAIRALEASEYVRSANPQVHVGWDPITIPVDPFADGKPIGGERVPGAPTFIGDVCEDGSLDMKDLLLLRKVVAGIEELKVITYADVNFDGSINMKDVLKLRKMIAGAVYEDHQKEDGQPSSVKVPEGAYTSCVTAIGDSLEAYYYRSHVVSFFGIDSEGNNRSSVGGVIDSLASYTQFLEEETVALPHLDGSFFEENVLVLGYVGSPYCNYEFTTDGVSFDGETLTVELTLHDGGMGLCAIEDYVVFTAVSRDCAAGASAARISPTSESGYPPAWW